MSKTYYWSDPHLGHDRVARLRGFDTTAEHDAHISDRWGSVVTKRDTIWILGDLAMSSPARALEVIAALPGTKHLILGNHDSAHPMHRTAHRQQRRYLDAFDSVQTMARHRLEGREVMVSHFPYAGDHEGTADRCAQYRLRDEGAPLIHGHVHDEWKVKGLQVNVGIDHWMDGPASAAQVAELIEGAA